MSKKGVILSIGIVIGIGIIFSLVLGFEGESATKVMEIEKEANGIGAVIHQPTKEQLAQVEDQLKLSTFIGEQVDEELLVIPYDKGSTVSLYEVIYQNDKFVPTKLLASYEMTTDKDVLYAKVPVPCGIPLMQVVIKGRDGQEGNVIKLVILF